MDYYKILGVSPTATADEIKRAFRSLAVKLHPDKNSSADAEQQFKQANEAHSVLSDPQQRAAYDQSLQPMAGFKFHTHHTGWDQQSGLGVNLHDIFANMFGNGARTGTSARPNRNPHTGVQVNITLEQAFTGIQLPVQFVDSSGTPVSMQVNIPAGVESHTRFKYTGGGSHRDASQPPGDLYVTVVIDDHPRFQRQAANLIMDVHVSVWHSILGVEKIITGINAQQVRVKVPAGSGANTVLRVAQHGMPGMGTSHRGDLLIRLVIVQPTQLSEQQTHMLTAWADQLDSEAEIRKTR